MPDIAAIVLAAGTASRYRQADPSAATKVVALYKGEPMVRHAVRAAEAAGLAPVVVVTGCEAEAVQDALAGRDVVFADNADYESGLASSLRAGVAALPESADACLVLLGDMPLVGAPLLRAMTDAFAAAPDAAAVVPVYAGQRGNPVLLARRVFGSVMELKGDEGARRLLRDPALKVVEVAADEAAALDIDTPDALRDIARR
ncbi:MAG: NTP transferase domain-containing protein [Beijerinckiaceae bacterium]